MLKKRFFTLFLLLVFVLCMGVLGCSTEPPKQTFTISFDANGGTGTMASISVLEGDSFTLPSVAFTPPTGSKIIGWTLNGVHYDVGKKFDAVSQNMNFEAEYSGIKYTVKFNLNGYEGSAVADMACVYGVEFTMPINPAKKRFYKDAGWNTDANGRGTKYESSSKQKNLALKDGAVVTLYAQMEEDLESEVFVSFVSEYGENPELTKKYKSTLSSSEITAITQKGYHIEGWYYNNGGTEMKLTSLTLTNDLTLTAKWAVNTAKLFADRNAPAGAQIYDSNGNEAEKKYEYALTYGGTTSFEKILKAKEYNLVGWNTKSNGTGTFFANGADLSSLLESESEQSIFLYAQWAKKDLFYSLSFQNVVSSENDIKLSYDEKTLVITASKTGFSGVFDWYIDGAENPAHSSEDGKFNIATNLGAVGMSFGLHTVMVTAKDDYFTYSQTATVAVEKKE